MPTLNTPDLDIRTIPTPQSPARDRSKSEHLAQLDRVQWSNDEDTYVILRLRDGTSAKGEASRDSFDLGVTYRFMGRWERGGRYGDTFSFSSFIVNGFAGKVGIVNYLAKTCDNIGEKTALRLWDKYGGETVLILRTDPDRVIADGMLSADVAKATSATLEADKALQQTRIDLHELLAGKGFHGRLQNQAIGRWGVHAPSVIRRDPFKLMGMAGGGFNRCDKLWREFGLPLDRLKRQLYAVLNEIGNDRDGNTWIPAQRAAECVIQAVGEGAKPKRTLQFGLRAKRLSIRKDESGELWIALRERAESELSIAASIKRLSVGESHWPNKVPVSQVEGDGFPSQHQVDELQKATSSRVGILIGGPGTGKTHSSSFVIRAVLAAHGRFNVAVCAPTGMAAKRMTDAMRFGGIDVRATTIHSLLEIGRNGHDGQGWGFLRNADNPLDQQWIICDETSMDDADLMADLLEACPTGAHVLFIGDPYQLPPVGHGAPLRDLIAAKVPTGELIEVRRNAGRIVHACAAIKAGRPTEFSLKVDLSADPPENLRMIECPAAEVGGMVERLMEIVQSKGFDPTWETQVIVALNEKGACSRVDLNARLQRLLNPAGAVHPKQKFRVNDKVICLSNTWLRPTEPLVKGYQSEDASDYKDVAAVEEMQYCANGQSGRVVAVGEKSIVATFGDDGVLVRVGTAVKEDRGDGSGKDKGDLGDFDLGYAVTGHKMQGSQAPCVIVCTDDSATSVASREWWYTSLSRASKLCLVVGPRGTFEKQASKPTLTKRKTFLVEAVKAIVERKG